MTRVQFNVVANLVGQSSVAILGIFCVPWFVRLLGVESYGVVAFHGMIAAAFGLLDLGLSTSVNRQLARLSGQPGAATRMRATVRTVGRTYWAIVLIVSVALFLLAPVLARNWFRLEHLEPSELTDSLRLMALAVVVQWPTVFYAGCVVRGQKLYHFRGHW